MEQVRLGLPLNAAKPTFVTELGIDTLVSWLFSNALVPILVTELGMNTLVI